MASRFALLVAVLSCLAVIVSPSVARADASGRSNAVHILEIDSDDADDQAEALTGALRSHVRASTGWNLVETTQSLSMLTAALRCPRHPDSTCLTKIGDRLKADRFLWGLMNRSPNHTVSVELHFWVRGEPDTMARATFSDNLKDPSDDALRKVATSLLDQLIGAPPVSVLVEAADAEGTVFVDGEERAQLEQGKATVQVPPGSHEFEVRGPTPMEKQTVAVSAGTTTVTLTAAARVKPSPSTPEASKPFPVVPLVGWGAIGAGVVFGVVAGLEAKGYFDANSVNNAYLSLVPKGMTAEQACAAPIAGDTSQYAQACPPNRDTLKSRASRDSALAWTFTGLGAASIATGAILLYVHNHSAERGATTGQVHVLPNVSPRGGSLELTATF